jgi:hypothetical protein
MEVLKMAVNAISHQQVAFRGNEAKNSDSKKTNSGTAGASFLGQSSKGDAGRVLVNLGVMASVGIIGTVIITSMLKAGSTITKWVALAGVSTVSIATIISAISAHKPSAEEK